MSARQPRDGTRVAGILALLQRAPKGMSTADIRQRFPGVRAKFINAALNQLADRGHAFRAEVFGTPTWFAVKDETRAA